jgi:hypothetical protein
MGILTRRGRHLGGILIETVSMLGSTKAKIAPDNKNFLAHLKESVLNNNPMKKATHTFGTETKSKLVACLHGEMSKMYKA